MEEPLVNEIPENIDKIRRRSFKALKAQSSYHIEYTLPGDENTVSMDLIVYGPLAKLYRGDDFKVAATEQQHLLTFKVLKMMLWLRLIMELQGSVIDTVRLPTDPEDPAGGGPGLGRLGAGLQHRN